MIRPVRFLLPFFAVPLILAMSGACASREALPTYYVLTPATGSHSTPEGIRGKRLFIRRVTLPGYLQTTKLASRRADSQIEYSPTARWAEPASDGIGRAVADALSRSPGIGAVSAPPLGIPPPRDFDLAIDIESFEGDDRNEVVLAARWQLYRPESAVPLVSRQNRFAQAGWTYGDEAGQARLLSVALQELGAQISRAVPR